MLYLSEKAFTDNFWSSINASGRQKITAAVNDRSRFCLEVTVNLYKSRSHYDSNHDKSAACLPTRNGMQES